MARSVGLSIGLSVVLQKLQKQAGAELSQAHAGTRLEGLRYADLDNGVISCSLDNVDYRRLIRSTWSNKGRVQT